VKRLTLSLAAAALFALALAPQASAVELKSFDFAFENEDGSYATQAGSHPYALRVSFAVKTKDDGTGKEVPEALLKDIDVAQIAGFAGDPTAVPPCSALDFLTVNTAIEGGNVPECSDSSAVGVIAPDTRLFKTNKHEFIKTPLYLLRAPRGAAAKLGFLIAGVPVTIAIGVSESPPYRVIARSREISQVLEVFGAELTLWGNPAASVHDEERGACYRGSSSDEVADPKCPAIVAERPFITAPRACTGPLPTNYAIDSWQDPGAYLPNNEADPLDPAWSFGSVLTHDEAANPQGFGGCGKLGFAPSITAQPTTRAASSPTGLDFSLNVNDVGLTSPSGIADSDIEKAVVTLPEGFSANPSLAEGLAVCTEAQLAKETAFSDPGAGCPEAAKIGTVEVETPLLEEKLLKGSLYVAEPYQNPFNSLLALYIVIQSPELGIKIVQPLRVQPDPVTGKLTTVAEEMPQLPFSAFRLHFREGTRSPLASPPACGTYSAKATLYPYSGAAPTTTTSAFQIISGPDEGPCPPGGTPPFHPGLTAGSLNAGAGQFSPFYLDLNRSDTEQEITHFSIKLPPGLAAKLAGIPFCPEAQLAQALGRSGPHGGAEELADPSCPAASEVGRTLAGAGVGPSLAYAPGKIYLAGPYHGAPISFVAITAGVVGPFDIGTVVVRLAIEVNPETGEVFLDSSGSDPIPHIVKGIPLHLRDINAYTDRPSFTFNPTSCAQTSTASTVLGAGLDFASPTDDNPLVLSTPFQAVNCARLPFRPKLSLTLKGQTKRGGNPALHAHLAMAGFGEAGLAYARTALPKTLFLDNAHIRTICTRVQFREGATEGEKCPPGSVIGSAKALTPILSEALEGPIYLRSNPERELPDIAASLQGSEIQIVAVGHTDSAPGGGLRNTFDLIPDAPISSVDINLFGGKRGLIESSRDLCSYRPKATVNFKSHNGKALNSKVALKATGCKKHRKHRAPHRRWLR
jgi:hypothetical protein